MAAAHGVGGSTLLIGRPTNEEVNDAILTMQF